jgi:hypothetical protein
VNLLPNFEERFNDNGKSKERYKSLCATVSVFLTKLLTFGDEVFYHCFRRTQPSERVEDRVLLALYRHTAEQLDCVNVLLTSGAVAGCPLHLRSLLEAAFGIAHIVQDRHEERALAYQLVRMKRHIKFLRRGDLTHPDGRQLETDLAADAFVPGILNKLRPGLAAKADECERQIRDRAEFVPILAEWERLKHPPGKSTQKDPEWYALFGGAKDIRSLAKQLKWPSLYDFFYRDCSHAIHASNVLDDYTTAEGELRPLRYPSGYARAFSFAFALYVNALERLASFYDTVLAQQVLSHANKTLNPEREHIVAQIESAIGSFK